MGCPTQTDPTYNQINTITTKFTTFLQQILNGRLLLVIIVRAKK